MNILRNKFTLHSGLQDGFWQIFSKIGFKGIKFFFSGFEFVAEHHEFVDFFSNSFLFTLRWKRQRYTFKLSQINATLSRSRRFFSKKALNMWGLYKTIDKRIYIKRINNRNASLGNNFDFMVKYSNITY